MEQEAEIVLPNADVRVLTAEHLLVGGERSMRGTTVTTGRYTRSLHRYTQPLHPTVTADRHTRPSHPTVLDL